MTSILFRNGIIHSPADPFAEALLVDDGVVSWLGADDTADGFADRADRVIDLAGALVTPGFVDSHVHILETAFADEGLDLSAGALPTPGRSLRASALDALAVRARTTPRGDVVLAHGWDESTWEDPRPLTMTEIDAVTGGAPVYAARTDVHCGVASSRFADLAGLRGLPGWHDDGFVTLDANTAARHHARAITAERRDAMYVRALQAAAARGVVAVHENSAPGIDTREGLATLLALTRDPSSALPLVVGYRGELCRTPDDAQELVTAVPGLQGIGGDLCVDGSLGARTAALRAPYSDELTTSGTLHLDAHDVRDHVLAVTAAGVQGGFHVIGDRALDTALDGLRAAADVSAQVRSAMRRLGHRLEHVEMVDAPAMDTFVALGIRLSLQPAFDAAWGAPDGLYASRLGRERATAMNPLAALASAGIPTAFGSDSPVTPLDPWATVRAAMLHHQPAQRISARAAFRAATRGGWRIAGLDHTGAGELRVGSPAHLAVWRAEHLGVQSAAPGLSSWSTDARSGTPLLPDLSEGATAPRCLHTMRDGVTLFDVLDQ
ncbi:amidohydrolase [Sanguibacter antarcticus]|uniref:amidohydrolase n=1 Tax=Sanguibacter antarcticus TaxID=372484 RepID=UPI000BF34752|nr:amidohydrolase family protein [Sanguibacter antarcticus]